MDSPSCSRCGIDISPAMLAKALSRGRTDKTCTSCRAQQSFQVGDCRPYQGEVDLDTLQPMKNGQPFRPGKRLCGNADCISKHHIEKPFDFAETYNKVMTFQYGLNWRENFGGKLEAGQRYTRSDLQTDNSSIGIVNSSADSYERH